jgi:phospholipid/cholesterol/gamma-HCH transport system substrate-binding protein
MKANHTVEISTGLFVLLGFAALFFLATQITNKEVSLRGDATYHVSAQFENIGGLKVGAPVSMAGVTIGRVDSISLDQSVYKAVVSMRINNRFNKIPNDSDASINTSGLLGGQYIGLTAGGASDYLKNDDKIEFVQDALVLEKLINQLVASFASKSKDSSDQSNSDPSGGAKK